MHRISTQVLPIVLCRRRKTGFSGAQAVFETFISQTGDRRWPCLEVVPGIGGPSVGSHGVSRRVGNCSGVAIVEVQFE